MSNSACATSRRSRAFYVDCLGLLVSDETDDALYLRGVEERNHHSIVLRRCARSRRAGARLQARQRGGSRPRRLLVRPPQPADRVPGVAAPGPHLAHGRCSRHAARPLRADGSVRVHAAAIRRASGRAHPAHRSSQLLHAGRAGELRLLSPSSASGSPNIPRPTAPIRSSGRCGCTARAMSTTSPSPTASARGCTMSDCGRRACSTSSTSAT